MSAAKKIALITSVLAPQSIDILIEALEKNKLLNGICKHLQATTKRNNFSFVSAQFYTGKRKRNTYKLSYIKHFTKLNL